MVELGKSTLTRQDLISVIKPAMEAGKDAEAIADMVAERISDVVDLDDVVTMLAEAPSADTPPDDGGVVIYDELPPGLIDLPSAAKRYDKTAGAMRMWVLRGHVAKVGLLKAPAKGGGYVVVRESDLVEYMNRPRNKGGRPKKGKLHK